MVKAMSKQKRDAIQAFRDALYRMVDDPASDRTVRWSRCGQYFILTDLVVFKDSILPMYFSGIKYLTFHRYLNQ